MPGEGCPNECREHDRQAEESLATNEAKKASILHSQRRKLNYTKPKKEVSFASDCISQYIIEGLKTGNVYHADRNKKTSR